MNAQEIYETVKDWPREAWPPYTKFIEEFKMPMIDGEGNRTLHYTPTHWAIDYLKVPEELAAMIFEASGARWLERKTHGGVQTNVRLDDVFEVAYDDGNEFHDAPTRLGAISAAVKATAGGAA